MDTESGTSARKFFQKPLFWLLLCAALSFVLLAYPIYVIRPFRYQGPRELMVALSVMRIRPALQILLVAAAAGLAVLSWKQMRGVWLRVVSCLCALLVCFFALLSRVNIYELM